MPDFGVALILLFGEVGVMQFVIELFDFFKGVGQTVLTLGMQGRTDAVVCSLLAISKLRSLCFGL